MGGRRKADAIDPTEREKEQEQKRYKNYCCSGSISAISGRGANSLILKIQHQEQNSLLIEEYRQHYFLTQISITPKITHR